jgi:glycosyltransferase involved in cell wall biosynthesis
MAVPPRKLNSILDPAKQAEHVLDYVLRDTSEDVVEQKIEREMEVAVQDELKASPLITVESDRKKSRVLFITRDVSLLEENSIAQLHFKNLTSSFDEIHVLVLSLLWQTKKGVERLDTNLWVYTTSAQYWWMQPFAALRIARTQLQFTDGFRPDVVVALDPFESGVAGMWIAEKYDRAFQVHVTEDFFIPEFLKKDPVNKWRAHVAAYVLRRTQSLRTATTALKDRLQKKYTRIKDLALLPRHYNIEAIVASAEAGEHTDAFPQFSFTVLFVGKLDHDSTLFRALDAARSILHSHSIGLVVVGNGVTKKEAEKRAEILGIKEQVVFESDETKLITYLKSADILICTDTTEASDEVVIKAAAAGLPILASETPLRTDLFTDGESAFLVQKEDTISFSQKLVKFLNTNGLRIQFAHNARDIIKTRLHEDPEAYKQAYRDSIEGVFGVSD